MKLWLCNVCEDQEIVELLPEDFAKIKPYLDAGLHKYEDGEEIDTMRPCPCCNADDREGRLVPIEEMPQEALEKMSEFRKNLMESYTFFEPFPEGKAIEMWYEEELVSVWKDGVWQGIRPMLVT